MEILAIIPVRAGSKGVPGKNMRLLLDVPLLGWSIDAAMKSQLISRVFVSTDCEDCASYAASFGVGTDFPRPAHLADDKASTDDVLVYVCSRLGQIEGYHPDYVVLLQATSPFRSAEDIDQAITAMLECKQSSHSVVSVSVLERFLWGSSRRPLKPYEIGGRPRRQEIPSDDRWLVENGSIYVVDTNFLMETKSRVCLSPVLFSMPSHKGFEIDEEIDFVILEAVMAHGRI